MKKIIVLAVSLLALATVASAQPRAIGVRLGGSAEVSYQHAFGNNFLEGDLGFSYVGGNGVYASAIFDFVFASVDNFNFYAGPGAQLGMYMGENPAFGLAVAGQLGAEYQFGGVPLNLSLDWRPAWNFLGNAGFGWGSFALGIRYRF